MFKRGTVVLTALVCLVRVGTVVAQNADKAVDQLTEIMKQPGRVAEKRALLAKVGTAGNLHALRAVVAATADKNVAGEARTAAGKISQALMAAEQPAYIRRSAFLRYVACRPATKAEGTVLDALRSADAVLEGAALGFIQGNGEGIMLESVCGEIVSLPPSARAGLLEVIASRGETAIPVLVGMAGHEDKGVAATAIEALGRLGGDKALAVVRKALGDADPKVRTAALGSLAAWRDASPLPVLVEIASTSADDQERGLALRGVARLALTAKPDKAQQAKLLVLLNAVAAGKGNANDDVVAAAAQIAHALSASHGEDVRRALDALSVREMSAAARQRIQAVRLVSVIDRLPNLARGGKASSPDGLNSDGPRPDAHAIDGDPATYWDETDGAPLYRLRIELGETTDVSAISLVGWAHHSFSPRDFEILCNDKTVKTVKGAAYTNNRLLVCFPRTRCASLELKITGCYGGSPAVRELGIFNAP